MSDPVAVKRQDFNAPLSSATDRLRRVVGRAGMLADRLVGSEPPSDTVSGPREVPSAGDGLLGETRGFGYELDELASRLEHSLERIERQID
jgi:hypothetical protein